MFYLPQKKPQFIIFLHSYVQGSSNLIRGLSSEEVVDGLTVFPRFVY